MQLAIALEESKKKINIIILGNDRERERKTRGLEARKKKKFLLTAIVRRK